MVISSLSSLVVRRGSQRNQSLEYQNHHAVDFRPTIRKAIYTTNAIESVNSVTRKFTKNGKIYCQEFGQTLPRLLFHSSFDLTDFGLDLLQVNPRVFDGFLHFCARLLQFRWCGLGFAPLLCLL